MNSYQHQLSKVGQLTPQGGAVVALVALALTAGAFALMASQYKPGR